MRHGLVWKNPFLFLSSLHPLFGFAFPIQEIMRYPCRVGSCTMTNTSSDCCRLCPCQIGSCTITHTDSDCCGSNSKFGYAFSNLMMSSCPLTNTSSYCCGLNSGSGSRSPIYEVRLVRVWPICPCQIGSCNMTKTCTDSCGVNSVSGSRSAIQGNMRCSC